MRPVEETPATASQETSDADELAALRKKKAEREAGKDKARQKAELERLRLEDRFEEEIGGLGRDFCIVDVSDLDEGFVVLKRGEPVLWTTFKKSKMNEVDTEGFVLPSVVHPTKDDYRKLVMKRPFVAERCANEVAKLYGVKVKEDEGKS